MKSRLLLIAVVFCVVGLSASSAAPPPGFDTEAVWSGFDDWEPTVATDPITADIYQLTVRLNGPQPCARCTAAALVFRRSSDAGASWGPDSFVSPSSNRQIDPQIAVASTGVLYAAWLEQPDIMFSRSADRGATWSRPIAVQGKGGILSVDKPVLAVSSGGQDVYVAFNSFDKPAINSSRVAASHDGGATFAASVKTNTHNLQTFHYAGAVAGDGTVYFAATDVAAGYLGPQQIVVLKSADGGAAWTTTIVDTSQEMPDCSAWASPCFRPFSGASEGLAVDPSGKLMITYLANDVPDAHYQVYVRTSSDGLSWSARTAVGSTLAGVDSFAPALAAGPTAGDFRLAFQDNRNGPGAWNTWFRRTSNGGGKWTMALRLSNATGGAGYKTAAGYAFPYGDYFGLEVDAFGNNQVVWGEGTGILSGGGSWYTRSF